MNKLTKSGIIVLLFLIAALTLGCYSEYVDLRYEPHRLSQWNSDSTMIATLISSRATRSPVGLTRLPDGGQAKYLLETVSLYLLDIEENSIVKIADFSDLAKHIGSSRLRWNSKITFEDSLIYYQVLPATDWGFTMCYETKTSGDSLWYYNLKSRYEAIYSYNINSRETKFAAVTDFSDDRRASVTEINKYLQTIPLSNIDLKIQGIYPKTDKEYIEEIIFLKNRSSIVIRAVVEQIIAPKTESEIRAILEKMDKHKQRLKGDDRVRYEQRSANIYEQIKALL